VPAQQNAQEGHVPLGSKSGATLIAVDGEPELEGRSGVRESMDRAYRASLARQTTSSKKVFRVI